MKYRVLKAGQIRRQVLTEGAIIELDDREAEAIQRQWPGSIERAFDEPPQDRMVRRARRKRTA